MSTRVNSVVSLRPCITSSSILYLVLLTCWLGFSGYAFAQTATETILHNFAGGPTDGANPEYSRLVQSTDGNFYGVTFSGGSSNNSGTFFKLTPGGTLSVLHNFGVNPDGVQPEGLILGSDGNFYGTTHAGGATGGGTVFKITPAGTETILYNIGQNAGDEPFPMAGVIEGSDGNFYGTTSDGGIIFKLTPLGVETILYTFPSTNGYVNGSEPSAPLVQGTDGSFYGTTDQGGQNSNGTIFKITPTGAFTKLHDFGNAPSDGVNPLGDLVQGSDGNFYGTTRLGGSADLGTVFKISPDGLTYSIIHSFGVSAGDGTAPFAGLLQGADGNFYGTTVGGGGNSVGTLFEISSDGINYGIIHNFGGNGDGSNPYTGLLQGSDGSLYGTVNQGGSSGDGIVFKLSPPTRSPLSFSQWETNYGVSSELPSDTPFGDWTPNLLKYFCDIDPTVSMTTISRAVLPTGPYIFTGVSSGQSSYLTLTYRQAAYVTGVTPNIQVSSDLQSWTTQTSPSPIQIGADFLTGDLIMRVRIPATDGLQFIRLQLVLTSP